MAYAIVQSKNASSAAAATSSQTVTPTSTLTAGNAAMATVEYGTFSGVIAVSSFKDQSGNTLSAVEVGTGTAPGINGFGYHLFLLYNLGSGITSVTANMAASCSGGVSVLIEEVSGLGTTAAALIASATSATSATTSANNINSGSSGTLSTQPAMLYAIAGDVNRSNHAPSAGTSPIAFTGGVVFAHPLNAANHSDNFTENARVTATTAVAATFTNIGTSGDTCPCILAVVAEAVGGSISISSVSPGTFNPGESGIVITGTGFSGSGDVVTLIDPNGTTSTQTVTSDGATSITFTCVQGNVRYGACTVKVTNTLAQSATHSATLAATGGLTAVNLTTLPALTTSPQLAGLPTPSRLYDTPGDLTSGAQVEYQVSGGSGSLTVNSDGSVTWAVAVKQMTWRWIPATAGTWSALYNWALVGLFPGFTGAAISDQTYTQNAAIATLDVSLLFADPEGIETPLTYSVAAGTLPTGLALSGTGQITGTPTALGTQTGIVIQATDVDGSFALSNAFSIAVATSGAVTFVGTIPDASLNVGVQVSVPTAAFFVNATTFAVTGALPDGVAFDPTMAVLSGVPTGLGIPLGGFQVYPLTVTGSNTLPSSATSNSFSLIVTNQLLDVASVVQAVVQAGLIPIVQYAANPDIPSGFVVSITPTPGTMVKLNTPVVIVVSTGEGGAVGSTTMPNVVGLYWLDATTALQAAFVSNNKYLWQVNAAPQGVVVAQSIAASTPVIPGAIVQLTLSAGPATVPPLVPVP